MGFGSRLFNLFSPKKDRGDADSGVAASAASAAEEGDDKASLCPTDTRPSPHTSPLVHAHARLTVSSPIANAASAVEGPSTSPTKTMQEEASKNEGTERTQQCSIPGCTRAALFARGKCHHHDLVTNKQRDNSSGKKMKKMLVDIPSSTTTATAALTTPANNNQGAKKRSDGMMSDGMTEKKKKRKDTSSSLAAAVADAAAAKTKHQEQTNTAPSPLTTQKAPSSSSSSLGSNSRKKTRHCSHPGCTRALFARGKCYRHDQEMKRSTSSSGGKSKTTSPASTSSSSSVAANDSSGTPNIHSSAILSSSARKKRKSDKLMVSSVKQPTPKKQQPSSSSSSTTTKATTKTTAKTSGLKHCSYPGCTRALFARGKCYRHDMEAKKRSAEVEEEGASSPPPAPRDSNTTTPSSSPKKSKKKKKTTFITEVGQHQNQPSSSTRKTKGHCSHPGCTRALFARGKCYRHDQEMKRSTSSSSGKSKASSSASASSASSSSSSSVAANDSSGTPNIHSSAILSSSARKKRKSDKLMVSSVKQSTPKKQQPSSSSTTATATATKATTKTTAKTSGLKHCSYPGCTRALFARGKCYRHDMEAKKRSAEEEEEGASSRPPAPRDSNTTTPSSSPKKSTTKKKKTTFITEVGQHQNQPSSSTRKTKGHCSHPGCTRALFARGKCYRHDQEMKYGTKSSPSPANAVRKNTMTLPSKTRGTPTTSKSSANSAVPILPSLTKALTSSSQQIQRKSAIARRPRQLKPTEKLLAMQEDALALYNAVGTTATTTTTASGSSAKVGGGGGKQRKSNKSPPPGVTVHGKREGSSPPNKKMRFDRGGDVCMEDLMANASAVDDDDDETNYDNVVCCLCKCGVDFSDADFFLPPDDDEDVKCKQVKESQVIKGNLKSEGDDSIGDSIGDDDSGDDVDDDNCDDNEKTPFQLPRRFYNPRNGLILCDGPAHVGKRRGSHSNGQQQRYECERAYHQRCHFIPVLSVPRGPWRCLICRYRDQEYSRKKGNAIDESNTKSFTDQELNDMFRCIIPQPKSVTEIVDEEKATVVTNAPPAIMSPSQSDIATLEQEFEHATGPLKAKLLQEDLTTKAEKVINAALSNIRNSEHSLRSFTETSRSRKVLAERIECIGGLPQELIQCVMRIAQNKLRIKDLIVVLEESIRCAPHHVNTNIKEASGYIDAVSELMQWYLSQSSPNEAAHFNPGEMRDGRTLLEHLFPEGDLQRRRFEPRTGEARVEAEETSVKSDSSGVSLDDLKCACCHGGVATDENDMLLCDGIGCYRAFHMLCLEPKMTLEEVEAAGEDEAWFCPLCTAHANLVHYAQREYLQDDWEHDWEEIMRRRGHIEWETANDVFPEAEVELRVAKKFKDGIKDEETTAFIAATFGIGTPAVGTESESMNEDVLAGQDDDNEEDDEDFDVDARGDEGSDEDSLAEDTNEDNKLLKEKIGRDELDALSVYSSSQDSENDSSSSEDEGLRRSKRRRFTFPITKRDGSSDIDQSSGSRPTDIGALDVANIVVGKRNRSKVDYRKLADSMFGDDSDEEAKGSVMKYDYKPKRAPIGESSGEDDSSDSSDESQGG